MLRLVTRYLQGTKAVLAIMQSALESLESNRSERIYEGCYRSKGCAVKFGTLSFSVLRRCKEHKLFAMPRDLRFAVRQGARATGPI
jgi:hypothetical protein